MCIGVYPGTVLNGQTGEVKDILTGEVLIKDWDGHDDHNRAVVRMHREAEKLKNGSVSLGGVFEPGMRNTCQ